ncbi:hypothetical protein [Adhaeribacter pallidiroseus]|uniref:Uncharacterized protein n=1 Tax=Adhaeribacter pallidiroseus TaxID=2072847 RepID=A0A369QDX2_9BACT|nr:hypothetical protein [Adhaeribacter pallidiroseus]RDC63123.1 hypothetical protein AHMF7616_01723 [Adhaeribacter pallidiroseus]
MKLKNQFVFAIFYLALAAMSCTNEEQDTLEPQIHVISEKLTGVSPTIVASNIGKPNNFVDYAEGQEVFDWENLAYLPLPPNNSSVPMPWNSRAKMQFSEDIRNDYKKSDGWELYLSSFSTKFREGSLTFSLYNKYRGVLRYYFFIGSGTQKFQDYNILQSQVSSVEESPLLNFTSQYLVDVNKNVPHSMGYEPQLFRDSSWYAVEYELAYDKNIYSKNSNDQIGLDFAMTKQNSLLVNGQQLPELKTKIRVFGTHDIISNTIAADAYYLIYGYQDLNQIATTLPSSNLEFFNNIYDSNVLSAIKAGTQSMHVLWNTKLNLQLAPNGVGVLNESFVISGANLSSIQGLGPFYNKALGIFYLNKKPTYVKTTSSEKSHPYQYTLAINSVEYLFNPAVLEIAKIENLQQELIATETESLIENNKRAPLFSGQILKSNKPLHIQGVKVSFEVVPKDGGNKILVVKTFMAEEEN